MAAERTLMAWIRTSMAMISFGFTIGKLGVVLSSVTVRLFGGTTDVGAVAYFLVIVGTLALIFAAIQYRVDMRLIPKRSTVLPSATFVIAILLSALGFFVFADLVTRL